MKSTKISEEQRVVIVLLLVFALFIAGFILRNNRKKDLEEKMKERQRIENTLEEEVKANKAGMFFVPDRMDVVAGQAREISLNLDFAGMKVDGADAYISFDPDAFTDIEIIPGSLFLIYPRQEVDLVKGLVKVTGFTLRDQTSSGGEFLRLKVAGSKAGVFVLNVEHKEGSTNLSTIVEAGTSRNILKSSSQAEITVM